MSGPDRNAIRTWLISQFSLPDLDDEISDSEIDALIAMSSQRNSRDVVTVNRMDLAVATAAIDRWVSQCSMTDSGYLRSVNARLRSSNE